MSVKRNLLAQPNLPRVDSATVRDEPGERNGIKRHLNGTDAAGCGRYRTSKWDETPDKWDEMDGKKQKALIRS